jgi:hypothetical protein
MNEIFSAFPLQAMAGQLIGGLVLIFIGLLSGIPELFNKRASLFKKAGLACLGTLVVLFGILLLVITAYMYITGAETVNAPLTQKRTVQITDSNGGGSSTAYRLYFGEASQFDIPQDAYDKMKPGTCYQVVYYPEKSVMQMLGRAPDYTVTGGPVTSIKENPSPQCR